MLPVVKGLDHLVLTVSDLSATQDFFAALGMQSVNIQLADGTARYSLKFGHQKINLNQKNSEIRPIADNATPGSAYLCFLTDIRLSEWQLHLAAKEIDVT